MKIILAEDDKVTRLVTAAHLGRWGHEVTLAENGAQAFQALQESAVSLVITDWLMPEMDGVELCRRVRALKWDRYIYLLVLTSLEKKEEMTEAFDAGADDYATKPVIPAELKSRIRAADRVISLERELSKRVAELEESLHTIRQLKELLPVCMYCGRIRNDNDYWQQIEDYIRESTGTDFSHGICPDCYEKIVKPQLEQARHDSGRTGTVSPETAPPTH